jgi:hypothetical protein
MWLHHKIEKENPALDTERDFKMLNIFNKFVVVKRLNK